MNSIIKKTLLIGVAILFSAMLITAEGQSEQPATANSTEQVRILLASTTSTDNSGLFGAVLPIFEEQTGIGVDVIAAGTGNAIALGAKGDVDIILVHARTLEDAFVADGYGVNRRDVMHNDFIILGPASDPAGIKGMADAGEALKKVASTKSIFVSRGDNSGTHVKELSLWDSVSIKPEGAWYREAGQGMGAVITMTDDMQGYTIADRGTYIAMKDSIDLSVVVEGDSRLFNPYGIIAVNPSVYPHVKYEAAMQLVAFFTSITGQQAIKDFTKGGEQLFYPDAIAASQLK